MDDLFTTAQAAPYVHRSVDTLRRWRVEGNGPAYVKVHPRLVMYRREDLDKWNAEQNGSAYDDHDLVVACKEN